MDIVCDAGLALKVFHLWASSDVVIAVAYDFMHGVVCIDHCEFNLMSYGLAFEAISLMLHQLFIKLYGNANFITICRLCVIQ